LTAPSSTSTKRVRGRSFSNALYLNEPYD
jgi:hypothetical protein